MERVILHSDMNNFYASVECMLNPELRAYPIAVCGDVEERHGIVLAKNYKAKEKGISTGEAIWQAKQKCPGLVIVPPHYDEYMKYSKKARAIYGRYTDEIEPFGMDECWLDVSGSTRVFGSGEKIAHDIKESIKNELGLTVSIGVSYNKVFAKLGSDMKKPDAVTTISKDSYKDQIWGLPAADLLGIGRATTKKLASYGIRTIGQVATWPVEFFERTFGKCGVDIWRFANGLDQSKVLVRNIEALDKSCGHGITALQDLEDSAEVWKFILELSQDIGHRLCVFNKKATGVAISVRDNDLFTKQWQCKIPLSTQSPSMIAREAFSLFERSYSWNRPIRSITVRAIDLVSIDHDEQINLFCDAERISQIEALDKAIEEIRSRYGYHAIKNATLLKNPKMPLCDGTKLIMPTGVPK